MKNSLLRFFGLRKPYRFERTLAILCSGMLAAAVGAIAAYYAFWAGLTWGTPRAWFFVQLALLVGVGIACAPWPRIVMVVLSFVTLEIGLGLGSAIMQNKGLSQGNLMPHNEPEFPRRTWHPLLQAVRPPMGLRPSDELRATRVVAVFGGSTTEDTYLRPGEMKWSEHLEDLLGADRFSVINNGSMAFSTAQMVVQTAFYESANGVAPACAVYFIGGIDVQLSHIDGLDRGYADYQVPSLVDILDSRRIGEDLTASSPTLYFLSRLLVLAVDTARPPGRPQGKAGTEPDPVLEGLVARNVRTISAINRQRNIRTIWIPEFVDTARFAATPADVRWGMSQIATTAVPGMLAHLADTLRQTAAALGDIYIAVPLQDFVPDDFVDGVHFTAAGSLRFARAIAPEIYANCR